jgi:hypothetical protein
MLPPRPSIAGLMHAHTGAARQSRDAAVFAGSLAVAFFAVDGLLIGGDMLIRSGVLSDVRLWLGREGGYAEWWQYAKASGIAALLTRMAVDRRSAVLLVWAALFAYVVGDDAGQWHERAGMYIGDALRLPSIGSMRSNHLGELVYLGLVGSVLLGALAAALMRGGWRDAAFSRDMVLWVGALAAFGVVLDAVHSLVRQTRLNAAVAIAEDGGEMVVLTLLLLHLLGVRGASAST